MNAALVAAAMMAATLQDSHVPSYTVDGNVVTIDAEIAWIPQNTETNTNPTEFELLDKSQQGPGEYIALISGKPSERIRWKLAPGTWEITALGHADDLANPMRQERRFTFTVDGPTRSEQIVELVVAYLSAKRDLQMLEPPASRGEILQAVIDAIGRGNF
jgi:hypothetical protein